MNKLKDILLIAVIVVLSTLTARLIIKLLINNAISLFGLQDYVAGLILPILLLFLEKNFTKNRLILTSIVYPIIITFLNYWLHISK